MPFEIRPLADAVAPRPLAPSPAGDWLDQQPFSATAAWNQIGNYRRGSVMGGPTEAQSQVLDNPEKFAVYAPPPKLTSSIAKVKPYASLGSFSGSLIDPEQTISSLAEGIGFSHEQAQHITASEQGFFDQRDINLGNAPSRLIDPVVFLGKFFGGPGVAAAYEQKARDDAYAAGIPIRAGDIKFNFQEDPAYWALLANPTATDDRLTALAGQQAQRYGGDTATIAAQLAAQFKMDRNIAQGLSSGDRRVDWQAKIAFTADYITTRTGGPAPPIKYYDRSKGDFVTVQPRYSAAANAAVAMQFPAAVAEALPWVGADIAEGTYQHPKQIEDAWQQLTPEQRAKYFEQTGSLMLVADLVVWAPIMGGLGSVQAAAAKLGAPALRAYSAVSRGYGYLRNVTTALMATGIGIDVVNWGLEAASPAYAESIGKQIDAARPISGSSLAGLVNAAGFFSSGSLGANLAARTALRVPGAVAAAAGHPLPLAELPIFSAMGGSVVQRILAGAGLNAGALELAPRSLFLSEVLNYQSAEYRSIWEAYAKGNSTGLRHLDDIVDPVERLRLANEALTADAGAFTHAQALEIVKFMDKGRESRPLLYGKAQQIHDNAVKFSRFMNDQLAERYVTEFGPEWQTRQAGAHTEAALMVEIKARMTRLGGDPAALDSVYAKAFLTSRRLEGSGQILRYLHQYEYHMQVGELMAAGVGADEAVRIMLVRADHIFGNDVPGVLAKLEGGDEALAKGTSVATIRGKREAAKWYADEWTPPAGVTKQPENVPPAELAAFLREVQPALPTRRIFNPNSAAAGEPLNLFHGKLEADGQWALGYKPTDDAGNLVSYVRRPNGQVFRSPWVEYPLGSTEAINLGNRGLFLSKVDGIFRGVRTWHLVEFQKGLLFRSLTSKLGPKVNPDQIGAFHAGTMRLAHEWGYNPQTAGAVARTNMILGGAGKLRTDIDKLVKDVFGPGPHLTAAGKPIDFYAEIAKAYRQSFHLNLTAGLTSYLKTLPGGGTLAWVSDVGYVMWRFNLSPIFKVGEIAETAMIQGGRGAAGIGPAELGLYKNVGLGGYEDLASELAYAPEIAGTTNKSGRVTASIGSGAAQARTMAFYARQMPETFALKARTVWEQRAAAEMRATHGGGDLPTVGWVAKGAPQRDILGKPIYTAETRVVTPDEVPPTHTTLLGEIDPESLDLQQLASEQGVYHATASLPKVYDEGVKPRLELPTNTGRLAWTPAKGEAFQSWLTRSADVPEAARPLYAVITDGQLAEATQTGRIGGGLTGRIYLTRDPAAVAGARVGGGMIAEVEPGLVKTTKNLTATSLNPGAINREWRWSNAQGDYVLTRENMAMGGRARVGLGGGGQYVSTTSLESHAQEIARRFEFMGRAARNEVDNGAILDHFAEWYGDDWYTMAKVLGAEPAFGKDGLLKLSPKGRVKQTAGAIDDSDTLVAWMDTKDNYTNGQTKFEAVQRLDGGLANSDVEGFTGFVDIGGTTWQDAALIDPNQVGYVRLAVRRGVKPITARGYTDAFELAFKGEDVLVIDDRVVLDALADTEEGLAGQLRATLAEQPKPGQLTIADHMVGGNGIAPGMETRARAILTKLEDMDRKLDGGPTWKWETATPDVQAEFEAQLADEGWHPAANGTGRPTSWADPGAKPPHAISLARDSGVEWDSLTAAEQNLRLDAYHIADNAWHARIVRGVALGKITPKDAIARGWADPGGYTVAALPEGPLYHVTTAKSAVLGGGLKTRDELNGAARASAAPGDSIPSGLGGGATDTVSFTTDLATAQRIEESIGEFSALLNRRITERELMARARAGGFEKDILDWWLKGLKGKRRAETVARIERWFDGMHSERLGLAKRRSEMPGYEPIPDSITNRGAAVEDEAFVEWVRPMTEKEQIDFSYSFYTRFLTWQEFRGGPKDPLFFLSNPSFIKGLDPADIGIIEAHPIPGAMGYSLGNGGLAEWRTWSGDAVTIKAHGEAPAAEGLYARTRLDGTTETKPIAQLYDEYQRKPGAASSMEDIAGTPEAFFDLAAREAEALPKGRLKQFMSVASNPAEWKYTHGVDPLTIKFMRDRFPSLLRNSGNEGVEQVLRKVGGPENRWLDWLIKDRELGAKYIAPEGGQAEWDALIGHVGKDAADRATMIEFYGSDEWAGLSALIKIGLKQAHQEAFSAHFFNAFRSPLERSLNHPILGLYPISWTLKAAREWALFLFQNKTLGVNIGMTPMVALANIVHAQKVTLAQGGADLDTLLGRKGPLGSPIFIFNLIMPGDWSGLPFSASRLIRDYGRAALAGDPTPDGFNELQKQIMGWGWTRDWRLASETAGQIGALFAQDPKLDPKRALRHYSIKGNEDISYDPGPH